MEEWNANDSCCSSMITAPSTTVSQYSDTHGTLDLDIDEPNLQYDFDFDLRALSQALRNCEQLEESGYQSVVQRSTHSNFGTGWMFAADTQSLTSNTSEDWDGYMMVGTEKLRIKDVSDLLALRYSCISGGRTKDGYPVITFPDSRTAVSFPEHRRILTYLLQIPALDDSEKGYIMVVDRRLDRWSSVRTLLLHLSNYFPARVRVVFLLKPEGVLQRALEMGYKTIADSCQFKVVICHHINEVHSYVSKTCLTPDLNGTLKYNHLEWVQHRMDIERMKSSASVIASSLDEFSRCLRETELPNDASTTEHILDTQRAEREAIKEDFRIAVRKGLGLLKNVRQAESKPRAEQLSPTRLHNVTSIQRMLIQLEETEKSFDKFWNRHETRLVQCLQLRRFEEDFRKLQASFAGHMLYLEEHRSVGDCPEKADQLIEQHQEYMQLALEDVQVSVALRERGAHLMASEDKEGEVEQGSLKPKCDELQRMAIALQSSLDRRLGVLHLSKQMHLQLSQANCWCRRGVNLLANLPWEMSCRDEASQSLLELDQLLQDGDSLQISVLHSSTGDSPSNNLKNLILLTTTETSTLLKQVSARIEDVRRLCEGRRSNLERLIEKDRLKPVQAVSPERHIAPPLVIDLPTPEKNNPVSRKKSSTSSPKVRVASRGSMEFENMKMHKDIRVLHEGSPQNVQRCSSFSNDNIKDNSGPSKAQYVIHELVNTEEAYVCELTSLVENYVQQVHSDRFKHICPSSIRSNSQIVFGNLEEICDFHQRIFLGDIRSAANNETPAVAIANCFLDRKDYFSLYHVYCQHRPQSELIRQEIGENHPFFQECQNLAGHRLSLGAYLLKPVQRITKYQLLLKELLAGCSANEEDYSRVNLALDTMLDLLNNLNSSMHLSHITGYPGHLASLGNLLMQGRLILWQTKCKGDKERSNSLKLGRRAGKPQQRQVFLYPQTILMCKQRIQPSPLINDFYEYKLHLKLHNMSMVNDIKGQPCRFELWCDNRGEIYTLQTATPALKDDWVNKIKKLITDRTSTESNSSKNCGMSRPVSWASTSTAYSSDNSSRSSRDLSGVDVSQRVSPVGDSNNNPSPISHHDPETTLVANLSDPQNNFYIERPSCTVLYEYKARAANEMSVVMGESVTVLTRSETQDWSLVSRESAVSDKDSQGWIPTNFLGSPATHC